MSETVLTSIYNLLCGWRLRYRRVHLLKPAWHTVGLFGPRHLLSASVKDGFYKLFTPQTHPAPPLLLILQLVRQRYNKYPLVMFSRGNCFPGTPLIYIAIVQSVLWCVSVCRKQLSRTKEVIIGIRLPHSFIYQCFPSLTSGMMQVRKNNLQLIGCFIVCSTDP